LLWLSEFWELEQLMPIEGKEVRFAAQLARNSIRWVTGFFLLLLAVYGVDRYFYETRTQDLNKTLQTLEALSGRILVADEKLTNAALSYAASGDEVWRIAYDLQVPVINKAIEDVLKLASPESADAFDKATRISNDRLIGYETEAFGLAKSRNFAAAVVRMRSTIYGYHKQKLARGTSKLLEAVRAENSSLLSAMWLMSKIILSALLAIGLIIFALLWRRLSTALDASEKSFLAVEQSVRDELATAQVTLLRQSKLTQLGQLTATVAHELRNPLGAVRTSAFLIERKYLPSNPEMSASLERIKSGVMRCDTIITQLLDFARNTPPSKKSANLDDWLESVLMEQDETLPYNIDLTCVLGLAGQTVEFDGDRLRRVIINLVSNASEAMVGKQGTPLAKMTINPSINVSTLLTSRGVEIRVQDNGPGMTQVILDKIFEPLFSTKSFGTGLGLPAVQRIMEQHGGGLDVTSVEGQGSTFIAWLPLVSEETRLQAA
jgi:signal transduction histidine kinase